jgi:hypothetical protein
MFSKKLARRIQLDKTLKINKESEASLRLRNCLVLLLCLLQNIVDFNTCYPFQTQFYDI